MEKPTLLKSPLLLLLLLVFFLTFALLYYAWSAGDVRALSLAAGAGLALAGLGFIVWRQQRELKKVRVAQEIVAASVQRYRAMFENIGAATAIIEADGTIAMANEGFARLAGYPRQEIEGRKRWTEFVVAEDLEVMQARHRERRTDPARVPTKYEFRFLNKEGELKHILLYIDMIPGTSQSVASLVDVTELKEVRSLAREREEMFRALAENSEDVIMRFDRQHRHLYVNPAVEKSTGLPPTAFLGKTHQELGFPAELVRLWEEALDKVFQEGVSHRLEFQLPSGVWIDWLLIPERDGHGDVHAVMTSARDISQRRRAEDELRRSEGRFRDLFEHSRDLIYTHDLEGRVLSINPAGATIIGYKREEIIGRKVSEFISPSYRRDFEDLYMAAIRQHGCASGLMSIETPRGERRILEYNNTLRNEEGEAPIVRGIVRDITERWKTQKALEKSESKYRSIFERASEGIFQYDREGRFISVNRAMAQICGYASPEEMINAITDIGRQFFVKAELLERFRAIINDAERVDNFEHKVYRRDGSEVWVSMSVWAVRGTQGETSHFEGTMTDISGRINAEKERRRLEHDLAQAQKLEAIGTLAGGIAHDFNNLLMGIQGYTSLALMGTDPSHPHYEYLKGIEKQVASGADLTKQILGYARGGRYEKKPADMNELIEKTTLILSRSRKDVFVQRKLAADLWTVEVDTSQMERVLMNLFVNACQAMPGGGEMRVASENILLGNDQAQGIALSAGRYIHVSVTDTGVGMSPQTMSRIFDPFFTTKAMGRGTGLGLATVYGIIKGHEGAILVESELGLGTTFRIYLPASDKTVAKTVTAAAPSPIKTGTEAVLVVDDEDTVLSVSRDLLEILGYRVRTARNGQEAVDILAADPTGIDLVILDMIMPGLSGEETFMRLRRIAPGIKILLSSGYSIDGQAQEIMDRGCNGFLQKPFQMERLAEKVREVLQ
ncbi:MAG: PAS domain S-box protein [Syntrophobacterales bacterium]|nr:PAS domain S-box protein [Syntrophobacterales bacterium]